MDNEVMGWIDAAQQADDPQHGIRCALVAIAISLSELVALIREEK